MASWLTRSKPYFNAALRRRMPADLSGNILPQTCRITPLYPPPTSSAAAAGRRPSPPPHLIAATLFLARRYESTRAGVGLDFKEADSDHQKKHGKDATFKFKDGATAWSDQMQQNVGGNLSNP